MHCCFFSTCIHQADDSISPSFDHVLLMKLSFLQQNSSGRQSCLFLPGFQRMNAICCEISHPLSFRHYVSHTLSFAHISHSLILCWYPPSVALSFLHLYLFASLCNALVFYRYCSLSANFFSLVFFFLIACANMCQSVFFTFPIFLETLFFKCCKSLF